MAGLFKNRIIKEQVEKSIVQGSKEKLEIIKAWHDAYESGELQKKTETQCEQAFNSDIFLKVLGYAAFPKDVYTIQPKDNTETKGGQIPDATLGYFTNKSKRVIAVVEIKDANTSLDKSQHRQSNLSPVQQGFKYKPLFKECGFVIVTNFFEIRIFRDNQLDYERFTLPELVDPKDDYFQFRKFYFLLAAEHFVIEKGQTETEKLLSAIRIEQEEITSKFYAQYKQLRQDLIRDIVQNNKDIKRSDFYTHIVEKAQKIIDRVVLICFFEDSGLLPENKLSEVVEYAQKGALAEPVWETMKRFFLAIDEGSERLGVPYGYNGELFKLDEDLNKLKISDETCKRFVGLSRFDFAEDLSVNILGHIFEQSISDLEKLKSYSKSEDAELDKKDGKRKKEGIYYTPEYIVDYIVKNSLGKYLNERETEIFEKYKLDSERIKSETYNKRALEAYTEYQQLLRSLKVLDPACGSGAFLVKAFDFLLSEHKRVGKITSELHGAANFLDTEEYVKSLLQDNLYGVDLNPESVELTKLSLWLKSAQKGQKLVTLKENIKCGNSLIDDPAIAGERAFDWQKEFPKIMQKGGFDVVIGNPPYVQLSKVETTTEAEKKYLLNRYKTSGGRLNTFIFFIHLAADLVKDTGYLGYIIPNTLLTQEYYADTRKLLVEDLSISQIISYPHMPFADAIVENITLLAKKSQLKHADVFQQSSEDVIHTGQIDLEEMAAGKDYIIDIRNNDICKNIDALAFPPLSSLVNINQAIALKGDKSLSVKRDFREGYYKLIDGKNINRYSLTWTGEYLEYDLSRIHSCKTKDIFLQPKLLFRRVSSNLIFTYDDSDYFALNTLVVITPKEDSKTDLKALLAILNSALINYYYVNKYKSTKKVFSEIQARTVGLLPIPKLSQDAIDTLSTTSSRLLQLNQQLLEQLRKIKELLAHELGLEKVPKKLDNWDSIDFDELIRFSKIKVGIHKRMELMDFLTSKRPDISLLRNEIQSLNENIDALVYRLYGISEEKIAAIESAKV
ncbi:MAG TPA: TaqI-like C-terminal specificity domain-containing protein [Candidatus Paceibacterota bacterium]